MDPAKMKVVDLRSELGALGLDTKGNKPALVERLKKALEAKTGKAIVDTTILDTSTEDAEEPATPKRPTPAARTTRRSSSSRLAATPLKIAPIREDPPEPIAEETKPGEPYSPSQEDSDTGSPAAPIKEAAEPEPIEKTPSAPAPPALAPPAPEPSAPAPPSPPPPSTSEKEPEPTPNDEEKSPSPEKPAQKPFGPEPEPMEVQESANTEESANKPDKDEKMEQDSKDKPQEDQDDRKEEEFKQEELTEEEEWDQLNERLRIREQERLERERKQAEDDAKRIEELSNDPVRLNRLKRKQEKKARWSNFYRAVEVTNEVLTLPEEAQANKDKKEASDIKIPEPEIDDNKITLSWYDSDLNQYLEVPELNGVVPLTEGAFAHAWAGSRASHGVDAGRVCYEVRVGTIVTTTESSEKETIGSGLRIGWSTDDSTLHLGEGEFSWGYESTGRAVNNSEFKDYGKQLNEKDVIGAYLDLESNPCKISYTVNGAELGTAFEFDKATLNGKPIFPHVLTKNMCYKVNFGYDRYNMLTKTKIVRKRVEIPVEQVLEEKRAIEAELQRQKEEAAKKERERREKEKKEREERQRKKREEREKQENERKEKEAAEKKASGEEVPEAEDEDKDKDKEQEKEKEPEPMEGDTEKADEPKENGDKTEEQPAEVKDEPMEVEPSEPAPENKDVKEESAPDGEPAEVTEEEVLKGHVLDKRIKFVIRYTVEEELDGTEADILPGYVFICKADIVEGPARPATLADCEVILMVGMPGSGKTYWAKQHAAANPDKRYNILSTGALFDRMKVDCKPFRASYDGRWDAMVSKCAKCVLKLLEIAKGRKRNFILDQTNVYPSAQRRKLREFDGYRRIAVVIVTDDETYRDRQKRREEADGKEVPDGAIVDMKANFALPERCSWLDDVLYPALDAERARAAVDALHREARAAGVLRDKDKRERSATRDAPPGKRRRSGEPRAPRHDRRNRDLGARDRVSEDRWSGGGRWGGAGGGRGSRWGPPGRGDFGRNGGGRGGGGRGGGRAERGRGGPPLPAERFGRDRHRSNERPDKRPHQPGNYMRGGGAGNNSGGGAGSWQRGGQMGNNRGAMQPARPNQGQQRSAPPNQKDGQNQNQNQNQQNQQGWNQWAGGWGGWGNWNQNQGWGNWSNWGNWGNPGQGSGASGAGGAAQAGKQQQQQQWPANYTAQQWYQWQQWQQQQQQAWPGYQQGNQTGNAADAQAWAQYYQNYGNANTNSSGNAVTGADKK